MGKHIVITGIGIVSPIGTGRKNYWDALIQGKTGFRPVSLFDTSPFNVSLSGEITDFDAVPFLGKKGLRELDRSTRLLNVAAKLALDDAGLEITGDNGSLTGVSVGSTFGSLHSISQFDQVCLTEGPRLVNPSFFPNTVINSPASRISIRFKIKGFNTTISTGFCAGLDAMYYAADSILLDRASIVLAGGVEELCGEIFTGFHKLGLLSGMDTSPPRCCPFDIRRNGLILSEGAAVIVLEDIDYARTRGAAIMATILGWGNSFDPFSNGTFRKAGKGLKNAIVSALKSASLNPGDIDYICSSANSTTGLDRMETEVIKNVFQEYAYRIPVSSVKSMIGESYSASGALAAAAAVGAVKNSFIPPTVNCREKDPACDLDYVPDHARKKDVRNALVLSSDPYGNNTAVVIGKYT
jgi:3-oxoacyl-[acyl-carrier-protein] synthase II